MAYFARFTPIAATTISTPRRLVKRSRRQLLTQVGRALEHLGIEHIAAYSPQARGRSERLFRTLQDRLPKEIRLAGIATIAVANAWLRETFMADHNAQFAIAALEEGSAFVADAAEAWREVLCITEERIVAKDNTVAWNGKRLQIPESRLRPHFVKATVRVHEYPDGTMAVFLGPHLLARYDAEGAQPILTAPTRDAGSATRVGSQQRTANQSQKPGSRRKAAMQA